MQELRRAIAATVKELYGLDYEPILTRPTPEFGDYATNAAMQLANEFATNPQVIAEELATKIAESDDVKSAAVAGPGFINIRLHDKALLTLMDARPQQTLKGQEILVEFGDPNPFKEMHIGHLYSYIVGESLCRLLESQGAEVERLSYHGDVGLHVAKALWGMRHNKAGDIGSYYQAGAKAYEEDVDAKSEIEVLNDQIYQKDDSIKTLYEKGKTESFEEFDKILKLLGIHTDKRYLESDSAEAGQAMVEANIGKVFEKSDGAIVYKGEQDGLHTRVFITSKGLPTYEAKDLGLAELKDKDYPKASRSIIITANEQAEYFKVMLAALAKIKPEIAGKTTHLYHGFVNLSTGKMSSRRGEVFSAQKLIDDVAAAFTQAFTGENQAIELGAIKYGFLKHRLGQDIIYNPAETVSLDGDSGPYLQYAQARARSILSRAALRHSSEGRNPKNKMDPDLRRDDKSLEDGERDLARKIGEFAELIELAASELLPSHICTYLYELSQEFNRFYEKNRVLDNPRQTIRLRLVEAYANNLKNGLELLNIEAPDKV